MRTGQVSHENRQFIRTQEQRDLGVGAISAPITGGNVLVPTGFDPTFHSALKSYGQLVDAVYTLNTGGGGPIDVATENDTSQGLTLISEATAVTENDPSVAGFQSLTDTATSGLVSISNQLLQDSQFDLDPWIQNKLAGRYYRGLRIGSLWATAATFLHLAQRLAQPLRVLRLFRTQTREPLWFARQSLCAECKLGHV